jgi:hypothetical protein
MRIVACAATALALLLAGPADARKVCNHDPVCQAKRDRVSVASKEKLEAKWRAPSHAGRTVRGDCRMRGTC